jgi:ABC-type amino acid transport substrate-binding protein
VLHRLFSLALVLAATVAHAADAPRAKLRLASLEWAPYVGRDLPRQGYAAEVLRAACARHGVDVEIDFLPWARALLLARRGDYDGLFPEYYDASREPEFRFSVPFPGGPVGLYQRRDRGIRYRVDPRVDLDAALRGLAGYRIGVVRGYLNNPVFDAADYLQKEEAVSDAVNLRKLYYGRVDLAFIDQRVADYLLATDLRELRPALAMVEPAIEEKPLYVAYARRALAEVDAKRRACDRGLEEIAADGTLAKIRETHRM